eukprot:CAMPEP_0202900834 /NCGR_PEP_ID=MMETSP1392-20130828/12066_1 /ASSEMBLY_ACC=CAM_ASM_000868 /TAXON_ID=225041 /ORGANISM="Chlamydomonas chlamydogama, Strain SAG 11-48b" /LENGTH=235 /DNA_ID=CAMNT_0049587287 /DNA_START=37 /DNA_END=740 /DNA_ORIENTATION=-
MSETSIDDVLTKFFSSCKRPEAKKSLEHLVTYLNKHGYEIVGLEDDVVDIDGEFVKTVPAHRLTYVAFEGCLKQYCPHVLASTAEVDTFIDNISALIEYIHANGYLPDTHYNRAKADCLCARQQLSRSVSASALLAKAIKQNSSQQAGQNGAMHLEGRFEVSSVEEETVSVVPDNSFMGSFRLPGNHALLSSYTVSVGAEVADLLLPGDLIVLTAVAGSSSSSSKEADQTWVPVG